MKRNVFQKSGYICLFLLLMSALTATGEDRKSSKDERIDINFATAEQIEEAVPMISHDLAKRIIEYREKYGKFQELEELNKIDGFTDSLLEKVRPFLVLVPDSGG